MKIKELEMQIKEMEHKISILENLLLAKVPSWAEESLKEVKNKKEMPFPFVKPDTFGSYDYYRIITLLVKNKII